MKDKNRAANQVLADMMFFDYLKEKVGERKTKTGAYYDLLEKATAGFIAPFLKNHEYRSNLFFYGKVLPQNGG